MHFKQSNGYGEEIEKALIEKLAFQC